MVDNRTAESRSALMAGVRQKNTSPEMIVRRLLHRMGYRFRLHRKDLPGRPDVVLPRLKKVIFVHGCFWHQHDCKKASLPKSNVEFWTEKLGKNVQRDQRTNEHLELLGWTTLTIWECETKHIDNITSKIIAFLSTDLSLRSLSKHDQKDA
jgi:DNA mismatch endonuclease, patch repair protein